MTWLTSSSLAALLMVCIVFYTTQVVSQAPSCLPGWSQFGDSCYRVGLKKRTWFEAEAICSTLGGHLATINSTAENAFHLNLMRNAGVTNAWIGLNDLMEEGQFMWGQTAKSPVYTNWHPIQPDNFGDDEDCVELSISWGEKWNDKNCLRYTFNFICQRPLYTCTVSSS